MKCRKFKYWLDEYLDGELPDTVERDLIEHKNSCESCRLVFEKRLKLFAMMKSAKNDCISQDLADQIMETITAYPMPEKIRYHGKAILVATTFALAVFGLLFFTGINNVMNGTSIYDSAQKVISSVHFPEEMNRNWGEMQGFFMGWISASIALLQFVASIVSVLILEYPHITLMVLGLLVMAGIQIVSGKSRFRKSQAGYNSKF
ncbi:zf-HC2 domain-containing protein [bacterium]|nr:zf-HC2 domain-containing protein [candidate division CSSED10-310 bacterium]